MYDAGKLFDALFEDAPERGQVVWLDRLPPRPMVRRADGPGETGGSRLVPFATFVARAQARARARRRMRGRGG